MKRYIKSSMERPYLYIFKHGLGPGTLPHDVNIVKTKDLPRGYTAVWTDRFLTTQEMDQYDIPYETEINRYLDRIGYCQKNGDVVPCTEDPYGFDDVIGSCGKKSVKAATDSNKYTIKSVSDDGIYYLVKDWRKNKELWVNKEKMDRHPEWWFTSSGKAKQSLKSLLSVMDEYLSDTFTVVDILGNETPLDVKDLGFDHIPDYEDDDVDACSKVTASTPFKYADKVEFEDIYPSDRDISFFFTSDDAAYAKKMLGDIPGLTGFSIQVSLPKDYNGNWQEALIYISPKTSDGHDGESDSDWTDITFDISDADMQSLVEQSWTEYKKRGWGDQGTKVTSSTKYTADMCSVGASDAGYEQLAEGDDADVTWTEPKYHAYSYYGKNYSGLEDDFATDDPSELVDWIWEHAAKGGYIEVDGPKDRIRLDPDDLAEQVELGGIDEYDIISQIDNI